MKSGGTPRTFNRERRFVVHESMSNEEVSSALGSRSLVRSLICEGNRSSKFRLLRLLSRSEEAPKRRTLEGDLRCVNLRYFEYRFGGPLHIPRQISFLWNLQKLRIKGHLEIIAPSEIWEMVQLRSIQVSYALYIPDPPRNNRVDLVLPNLHTLKYAKDFMLSKQACKRIPNMKRLCLNYGKSEWHNYCSQNLSRLHKLESITLRFNDRSWRHMVLNMTFPTSLKKLTLHGYGDDGLFWKDLEMIGSIPNLQVLKLKTGAIKGSVWNPIEGGFGRLKFLQIESCRDLRIWNADHFHFPVLEKLVVQRMDSLQEIPPGIGDITTLRNIHLYDCSLSCSLSAVKILAEQESLGNDDLQLEVGFFKEDRLMMRFREMVEEEGFTSNNLRFW